MNQFGPDFSGCIIILANNQDRVVTRDRSHNFGPLLIVEGHRDRAGVPRSGPENHLILRASYVLHKLAGKRREACARADSESIFQRTS